MDEPKTMNTPEKSYGSLATYIAGFVMSVALTLIAYMLVVQRTFDEQLIVGIIVGLAVAQFLVQVVFFLHLSRERSPRWNLVIFGFMLMVLLILVLGTLWIMNNLDYQMMPSENVEQQIIEDEGYEY